MTLSVGAAAAREDCEKEAGNDNKTRNAIRGPPRTWEHADDFPAREGVWEGHEKRSLLHALPGRGELSPEGGVPPNRAQTLPNQ
jgi:hypothetical protein